MTTDLKRRFTKSYLICNSYAPLISASLVILFTPLNIIGHACSVVSWVWLFGTLRTVSHQAPLSMRFSRQEYWSGLSCPPPGDLPDPGMKPCVSYISCTEVKSLSRAWLFATPWIVACPNLLCPWDFQGKSTRVGCHFLLQGISQPRDRTQVSHIVDRRFTIWATRERDLLFIEHLLCYKRCNYITSFKVHSIG